MIRFLSRNMYGSSWNDFLKVSDTGLTSVSWLPVNWQERQERKGVRNRSLYSCCLGSVLRPDNKPSLFHLISQCALLFGKILFELDICHQCYNCGSKQQKVWEFLCGLNSTMNGCCFWMKYNVTSCLTLPTPLTLYEFLWRTKTRLPVAHLHYLNEPYARS